MPPPKYGIKKRRSRRAQDFTLSRNQQHATSQPSTPVSQGKVLNYRQRHESRRPASTISIPTSPTTSANPQNDSDSDTACGFDSAWRGSAQL